MKTRNNGIFCLEGNWWGDLTKNDSMEPMLQLLSHSPRHIRYIHRNVATPGELEEYLRVWTKRIYKSFPVLYLGFHGTKGNILVGDQRKVGSKVTFSRLGELLAHKCRGKIIHFSSCETLDWHGKRLNAFFNKTEACCVTGYIKEVDWISSAAFELFVFRALQRSTLTKANLTRTKSEVNKESGGLARKLGFRFLINPSL
jgi:hypothetical protein